MPILVDPERQSYELLGMVRGVGGVMSLDLVRNARRAAKAGFRQGSTQGDAWQQGGVLVIRPDGAVPYRYISDVAGDHPPVEQVVQALEAAV